MRPSRALLVPLVCAGLLAAAPPASAQDDGFNFHVLSNFGETLYLGIGAGTGSVPGVDVTGYWIGGEDMQGNTLTQLTVGGVPQFGYKQAGVRLTACVFNLGANSRLDFPSILTTEYDDTDTSNGFNFNHPYNFLRPGCGVGTANPGVAPITTNIFGVTTGAPPGASFQWIIFGLPTAVPAPTTAVLMAPNHGLLPSAGNSGTVAIVNAVSVTAAISATGCYTFDLDWSAGLGSAVPALDDIGGWWVQLTASRDNNQYWALATDNLNVVKASTAFSSGGATGVFTGVAGLDLEIHSFSLDPSTNAALLPASYTADNAYYAAGAPGPTGNVGFDLGHHAAISNSGITGAHTPFSGDGTTIFPPGINPQDGDNAGVFIGATPTMGMAPTNSLGFTTWNNNTYALTGSNSQRITWIQVDRDLLSGALGAHLDPSLKGDATVFFGNARVPVRIPALPGPWPTALTIQFLPIYQHATVDQTGNTAFPDPSGLPAGALGVAPIAGTSVHLPIFGAGGLCAFGGLPVGLEYGSSGLTGPSTGPLVWDSTRNRVSFGRSILNYD